LNAYSTCPTKLLTKRSSGSGAMTVVVAVVDVEVPVVVVSKNVSDVCSLQNFSSLIFKKSKTQSGSDSRSKSRNVKRRNSFGRMSIVQKNLKIS